MRKLLTAVVAIILATIGIPASSLPIAPAPTPPVQGIPHPCPSKHPWPGDKTPIEHIKKQLEKNFGFKITGPYWTPQYIRSIRIVWETLDAMSCTPYTATMHRKAHPGLNAGPITGFAWGDWGLTRSGYLSLDFKKFESALEAHDEGRLVRLIAHEMGHAWSVDHGQDPQYWREFQALVRKHGRFSPYARDRVGEIFADTIGYYVGRCALNNPYDTGKYSAYYEYVKRTIFNGREFGPPPGTKPHCTMPASNSQAPIPGQDVHREASSWMKEISET